MLWQGVVPEDHRELLAIVMFEIPQRRPEHKTGQALEVTELFEPDGSTGVSADMWRLGAEFGGRSDLKTRLRAPRVKQDAPRHHRRHENRRDDRESEVTFLFFLCHKEGRQC